MQIQAEADGPPVQSALRTLLAPLRSSAEVPQPTSIQEPDPCEREPACAARRQAATRPTPIVALDAAPRDSSIARGSAGRAHASGVARPQALKRKRKLDELEEQEREIEGEISMAEFIGYATEGTADEGALEELAFQPPLPSLPPPAAAFSFGARAPHAFAFPTAAPAGPPAAANGALGVGALGELSLDVGYPACEEEWGGPIWRSATDSATFAQARRPASPWRSTDSIESPTGAAHPRTARGAPPAASRYLAPHGSHAAQLTPHRLPLQEPSRPKLAQGAAEQLSSLFSGMQLKGSSHLAETIGRLAASLREQPSSDALLEETRLAVAATLAAARVAALGAPSAVSSAPRCPAAQCSDATPSCPLVCRNESCSSQLSWKD